MTNMAKFYRTVIFYSIFGIIFFLIWGYVGDIDYCEQIILRMSQEQYDSVKNLLTEQNNGQVPSERDIAHWWDEHREVP